MTTAFVEVRGGPVEYRHELAANGGDGVTSVAPLVFLHEGLGSIGLWRTFVDDVRAAAGGPEVWVFNRHGHGWSAPAALPRPPRYMHEEALAVLPELRAALDIERPWLIGHSDGASIALIHAGAGHPVAGVVAIAPHVFVEDRTLDGVEAARSRYRASGMGERLGRYHADADATFYGWNDVWRSDGFRAWDITDVLAGVTAPVLVVQGEADDYGTMAQVDAIEAGVGGRFERLVVTGAGHSPHLDAPSVVAAAVARFVAGAV